MLKKLRKLSYRTDHDIRNSKGERVLICPCCCRGLVEDEELLKFQNTIKEFLDPDTSPFLMDQSQMQVSSAALKNYETWRNSISQSINDWLEYKRVEREMETIQETILKEEEELELMKSQHLAAKEKNGALKVECSELQGKFEKWRARPKNDVKLYYSCFIFITSNILESMYTTTKIEELHDAAKQFRNDARKVSEKKSKISEGQNDLSMLAPTANGKDLRTVEREISSKQEEKDFLTKGISTLNKELLDLNGRISRASNSASTAEKNVRDKEEKYAQEQKAVAKKQDLNKTITECKKMEEKVRFHLYPLITINAQTEFIFSSMYSKKAPKRYWSTAFQRKSERNWKKPLQSNIKRERRRIEFCSQHV